jgi:hypothetical protein
MTENKKEMWGGGEKEDVDIKHRVHILRGQSYFSRLPKY